MKRILTVILSLILLSSFILTLGVSRPTAQNALIRTTSSDAEDAAAWLGARLGERLTQRVVIGTDASAYGVDVSALEADGYFIRSFGREDALFAKTADGLDRAVRKYAHAVESGLDVGDVTYHEGARVKKFIIAGRDISEYTVYCEDEELMLAAAKKFADRIAEATRVEIPVSTDAPAAPYIAIKYVDDDSLGYVGYRFGVTEDGISIECSDKYKTESADVALTRLLVTKLDWFGLDYGFEDLAPADLVEWKAGESGGEKPYFDWAIANSGQFGYYLDHYGFRFGMQCTASHGLECNGFGKELSPDYYEARNWAWIAEQPCWTSEEFYDCAREDIVAYIEERLDAGKVIGKDFCYVDIAQPDNNVWCKCKTCTKLYAKEGSHAAECLTFANRISEDLNETYPGLKYLVFAYHETRNLPKTIRPNGHIYITFCYDHSCSNHPLDGSKCTSFDNWKDAEHRNDNLSAELLKWVAVTEKVSVWFYGASDGLMSMSYLQNVKDDIRFLYNSGVTAVYWEAENNGYDPNWIPHWLGYMMYWDMDMSDEAFDANYDRICRVLYGEGADYAKEYVDFAARSYLHHKCSHCWNGYTYGGLETAPINKEMTAEYYDLMYDLMERARAAADSADTEARCTRLECSCIFKGSISSYEAVRDSGDEARMAVIKARYAKLGELLKPYGVDIFNTGIIDEIKKPYHENLGEYFGD